MRHLAGAFSVDAGSPPAKQQRGDKGSDSGKRQPSPGSSKVDKATSVWVQRIITDTVTVLASHMDQRLEVVEGTVAARPNRSNLSRHKASRLMSSRLKSFLLKKDLRMSSSSQPVVLLPTWSIWRRSLQVLNKSRPN